MTTYCVAVDCKNLGVHLFPKDTNKRKLWEEAVNRQNWKSGPYSKLCSAHFRTNDYSLLSEHAGSQFKRKVLKRNAVPSLFSFTNNKSVPLDEQHSDSETQREDRKLSNVNGARASGNSAVCTICNNNFASTLILNEHIISSHPYPLSSPILLYACIENRTDLIKTVKKHTDCIHTHICQTCSQQFATELDWEAHLVKMRFPCNICKLCFGSEKELASHELTHPMLVRYPCSVCGEQFEENFVLMSHMRKHNTMKHYSRKKPKLAISAFIRDHSNTGRNKVVGSDASPVTGAVGGITNHNKDTGQTIVAVNEVNTIKKEQDESELLKIGIDIDVKREPDEKYKDEPLDWLQRHVNTEFIKSLKEKNIYIKEEADPVEVKTEESLFDMTLERQMKREPEENESERTV